MIDDLMAQLLIYKRIEVYSVKYITPNGWKATLSMVKKQNRSSKSEYLLRGLSIPAGEHNIEFRFEPASYTIGSRYMPLIIAGIISILVVLYAEYLFYGRKIANG